MTNSISKLVVDDMGLFEGSFVTSAVWWLLGADIDGDVYLDNVVITEPDLLRIGEGSIVARGAKLWTHKLQDWKLDMERIVLGKRVNVGANCLICMDTHMGDDSVLGACSVLMQQQTVKENELYFGNPADLTLGRSGGDSSSPRRLSSARATLPLDAPQQPTLLAAAPPQRWVPQTNCRGRHHTGFHDPPPTHTHSPRAHTPLPSCCPCLLRSGTVPLRQH